MNTTEKLVNVMETFGIDIVDADDVYSTHTGAHALRLTFDKVFTDKERDALSAIPGVLIVGTATHRYAPEIQRGYIVINN